MQRRTACPARASFTVLLIILVLALCAGAALAQQAPASGAPPTAAGGAPPPQQLPPAPPALIPPLAASPFVFTLKGTVAGSVFMQDRPFASGNGGAALFGALNVAEDGWLLGGDVRQSRLTFNVRGPVVLGGAIPSGTVEVEMYGGNQITSVPGSVAPVTVRNAMGMPVGTGTAATVTSSAQGDESLLPRLRTAYVELNWDGGKDIIRVGQFHNLLLAMISASALHPATLGYGAGQLGWRSPGITYLHKFVLSEDMSLDVGLQINRNSWIDNVPSCAPSMAPPTVNCVPGGVSLGEASMLPQFQARVMLSGGKAESPFITYAPNIWQIYAIAHWDRKDLSGVGSKAVAPARDSMDTMLVQGGFKLKLGPVLLASNGWVGKNSGNVYGNMIQMQSPDKPDVNGFGVWGQVGFSFSRQFSIWGFTGIDQPNKEEAALAGFSRFRNLQFGGMFAYTEGTFIAALELFTATTWGWVPVPGPAGAPPLPPLETRFTGYQPSVTVSYSF